MKVVDFVKEFNAKKPINSQAKPNAVEEYIKQTLEVEEYISFKRKQALVKLIVLQNMEIVDGIKKIDSISQYMSFVIAMLTSHTNLEMSDDPMEDYDLLAQNGLLPLIVSTFKQDYDECDVLLKMVVASELEDNNTNVLIGRFLDSILRRLEEFSGSIKDIFNEEDLAKLSSLLNK